MNRFGFVRITCASPKVVVADPKANAEETARVLETAPDSDLVLFPELGLTGYTCADLFGQSALLQSAENALATVVKATQGRAQLVVVGMPVAVRNSLFNCAVAIADGALLGVVPKRFLPNYREFYETRWFSPATGREPKTIALAGQDAPFGIDLLFEATRDVVVGIEICEDLWMPIPPSSTQALAGATVLLNLSASNETVGKRRYRTDLVVGQSGRCVAAYAYAGAGPSESTTDLVFGGHCLIAENGRLLVESRRVGDGGPPPLEAHTITVDVDVDRLAADRRATTTFDDASRVPAEYRRLPFRLAEALPGLKRDVAGMPFVPVEGAELHDRCAEIFGIQCAGLARGSVSCRRQHRCISACRGVWIRRWPCSSPPRPATPSVGRGRRSEA